MRVLCLAFIALLGSGTLAFAQCTKIDAEVTVTHTQGGLNNGKIVLEIKNLPSEGVLVSLFEPKGQRRINVEKKEFDKLPSGKYLVVITSKKQDDKYCPKSIDVTIN